MEVYRQVRGIAESKQCLVLCWGKLWEEVLGEKLRTGKDDGSSFHGENVPCSIPAQGADLLGGAVFAVESGGATPDALVPELVCQPVAYGGQPTEEGEAVAFCPKLIAQKVSKAVSTDNSCWCAHCGASVSIQQSQQERRAIWAHKLCCRLAGKPAPWLAQGIWERVWRRRQCLHLYPEAVQSLAFLPWQGEFREDARLPEPRV